MDPVWLTPPQILETSASRRPGCDYSIAYLDVAHNKPRAGGTETILSVGGRIEALALTLR